MVTVCQNCGDRGFEEALIYCDKCQDYSIHRYCLDVPAVKIFDEDMTWLCVDCEPPKIVKPSNIDKSVNLVKNLRPKKERRPKKKSDRLTLTRYVAKPKVQICEGPKMEQIFEGISAEHEAEGSNNCDGDHSLGKQCIQVHKDQLNTCHDVAKSSETSQITNSKALKITEYNFYVAAQPIIDPIWRGSLSIFNKDFNIVSGLVAHLSSLACPKVREEAEVLPLLLFPELVPRPGVWPKAFEKWGPSDQSIALYFFPHSQSDEKDFDNLLLSMLEDDLAMRAVLDNAELLVFTSTILPEQYQRFQSKIYLWGVFRAKQFPVITNNNGPEEKELAKTLTSHRQSPVSTLSNNVDMTFDPVPLNSYCSPM